MKILFDTDICIEVLRGRDKPLLRKIQAVDPTDVRVSTLVSAELWVGVAKSASPTASATKVEIFLARFPALPFTPETARIYGALRGSLEKAGNTIGPMDLLIASTALEHRLRLVTRNDREFSRIPGLSVEVW
jgi:tRNA(fMet)-specific endonuclease VapC